MNQTSSPDNLLASFAAYSAAQNQMAGLSADGNSMLPTLPTAQKSMSLADYAHAIRRNSGAGSEYNPRQAPSPAGSYGSVGVVYTAVRAKAIAMAALTLQVSTGDDQILESGPLVELTEQPNPAMTRRQFWQVTSSLLDLFGVVHWWRQLDTTGRVVSMTPINPLQMVAQCNRRTGELIAWKYQAAGSYAGQEEYIPADEIHTILDPDFENPHDPLCGLSPRRAAAYAIGQFYLGDRANYFSLMNDMAPSGYLKAEEDLTEEQERQIKAMLRDSNVGTANRRALLILTGNLEWQSIANTYKDMEFSQLKKMSAVDILAAFGVPPAVAGYYEDSNYAHADAAERGFWMRTILPRAAWLAEEWTAAVLRTWSRDRSLSQANARTRSIQTMNRCGLPLFNKAKERATRTGQRFYAWFDTSSVAVVQRALLEHAEGAIKWLNAGVPLNDINRAFDLPFPEVAWGDTWYKPIGLVDVREDTASFTGGDDGSGGPTDPAVTDDLLPMNNSGQRTVTQGELPVATRDLAARLWETWRRSWAPLEKVARGKVNKHFHELRKETLANLARVASRLPQSQGAKAHTFEHQEKRELIGEILFDPIAANRSLIEKMAPFLLESHKLGGEQVVEEHSQATGQDGGSFNVRDQRMIDRMRQREIRLTGVNRTMQKRIATELADALDKAEGLEAIRERLKHQFNLASKRAATIARNEISGAIEEARHEARRQIGVPLKSWLWSRKEEGRPTHAATERETSARPIQNDEPFIISGTTIACDHPRATGRPEHDINCGCTTISRYPDEPVQAAFNRYVKHGFLTYDALQDRSKQEG